MHFKRGADIYAFFKKSSTLIFHLFQMQGKTRNRDEAVAGA